MRPLRTSSHKSLVGVLRGLQRGLAWTAAGGFVVFSCLASRVRAGERPVRVAYISDLEGDRERLERIMAAHPLVNLGADGALRLGRDVHFVHGGDVTDRGPGGAYLARHLADWAEQNPWRVHLVAGNRDINKLRLPLELSARAMAQGPRRRRDDWRRWLKDQGLSIATEARADRLRWILARTMGAGGAFEFRRTELGGAVSDERVVESFLQDLQPRGGSIRLLEASRLAVRLGNTLFVHGSVTEENFGRVPGQAAPMESVDAWVRDLNAWYRRTLAEWAVSVPGWDGEGPTPGGALIAYCEPEPGHGENSASVVYSRGLGGDGLPALPSVELRRRLIAQGIQRIVVGHTPAGDTPVVVRSESGDFEVVRADQSRRVQADAASVVILDGTGMLRLRVHSSVRTADGVARRLRFGTRIGSLGEVGGRTLDGGLVVGRDREGFVSYFLEPGFRVVYRHQTPRERVAARLRAHSP